MSEYQRWEDRFSATDYVFGREPNYFLASCRALLPKSGKALAVADGEGRNGVWLAEQGLDVTSIDFSANAQAKAVALAKERGVDVTFKLVGCPWLGLPGGGLRCGRRNLHPIQHTG